MSQAQPLPSSSVTTAERQSQDHQHQYALGSDQFDLPVVKLGLWQRLKQFQPTRRLVRLVLAWWCIVIVATALNLTDGFGIGSLAALAEPLYYVCMLALALLALMAVIEMIFLIATSQLALYKITRHYPSNVPIYHELDIEAYLTFTSDHAAKFSRSLLSLLRSITFDFADEYPEQVAVLESMPIKVRLPLHSNSGQGELVDHSAGSQTHSIKIAYPVVPISRGTGYFGCAHLRVYSPLQLFRRSFVIAESHNTESPIDSHGHSAPQPLHHGHYLRVLADFSGLLSNQLSAIFERSVQSGVQAMRQQGHGSDFLKLREYSAGDAIRQIDWKASSRLRRLMSKAYEEDNDQDVVFLLDCGEQMRHQDVHEDASDIDANLHTESWLEVSRGEEGTSVTNQSKFFDKVLNSVLLLAYIANKQGDKVGLMTFGAEEIYLPPNKGASLIRNLLNDTADIKPTMQTSDYLLAAQSLLKKLKKRSVIILITNTRVEASSELEQAIKLLSQRHQVVFANLMEQAIIDRLYGDMIPTNMDDALLYHSLISYEQSRKQLHQTLAQHTGTLCLQTSANRLPLTLTQAYLSLKRH